MEAEFKVIFENRATIFVNKPYFLNSFLTAAKRSAQTHRGEHPRPREGQSNGLSDSMNDESMIKYAGQSVAMCNGRKEILDLAAYRTRRSNDDDGIADFLEEFVL